MEPVGFCILDVVKQIDTAGYGAKDERGEAGDPSGSWLNLLEFVAQGEQQRRDHHEVLGPLLGAQCEKQVGQRMFHLCSPAMATLRGCRKVTVRLNPQRKRSFHTIQSASRTIAELIFEWPERRSSNVIGTS